MPSAKCEVRLAKTISSGVTPPVDSDRGRGSELRRVALPAIGLLPTTVMQRSSVGFRIGPRHGPHVLDHVDEWPNTGSARPVACLPKKATSTFPFIFLYVTVPQITAFGFAGDACREAAREAGL
jgi:hypothetical protein